jgi:hypothetical protein
MVGRQQNLPIRHFVLCAVLKKVGLLAGKLTSAFQVIEVSIETDSSQRHYDSQILETVHFAIEIRRTIREFLWQRFVIGRSTADGGCDVQTFQLKSIVTMRGVGLIGKTSFV